MSVFRDERVRQALQSAIMDEILIDAPGTYRIVVPDKLIDRLETILAPFCADAEAVQAAFASLLAVVIAAGGKVVVEPRHLLDLPRCTLHENKDPKTDSIVMQAVRG